MDEENKLELLVKHEDDEDSCSMHFNADSSIIAFGLISRARYKLNEVEARVFKAIEEEKAKK